MKSHISIDFILVLINKKYRNILESLMAILFFFLAVFVCYYAWDWVLRPDVQMEMSGTTGLPRWYTYVAFPVAFSFLAWHQAVVLLNRFFDKRVKG